MQKSQKIIKCKIAGLTNVKEKQLSNEFKNIQILVQCPCQSTQRRYMACDQATPGLSEKF